MNLKLVKKIVETKDTKSFFFDKPKDFKFKSGQYIYLTLGEITKQFTISSSPTEDLIQITTKIREQSGYKKTLDTFPIGSVVEGKGPQGVFVFTNHYSLITDHLFLAGGIGITPFRSMIKYNIDQKIKNSTAKLSHMHLIYSNSDSDFIFKKELDTWQKENNFLKIEYIDTSKVGRIDFQKLNHFISNYSISCFWVVGPNLFVNAMEEILEQLNIPSGKRSLPQSGKILTEKFTGY